MASYANLTADQGADFETEVTLENDHFDAINLTGYVITGQARRTYKSSTSYNFVITVNVPSSGVIKIRLPPSTTASMKYGRYVYDIYATNATTNQVYKVLEGILEIVPRVTR